MKTLKYLFFLTLFAITACNGSSSSSQPDPEVAVLKTQVQDLTQALAAATHADAQKFSAMQLFVGQNSPVTADHALAVDFGPCTNAGVKTGSTGKSGLDEQTQVFKQTPTATCPGVYSEYDVLTGDLHIASRIYYTTTDCTGTGYEWDAGGFGFDRQKLEAGVSFMSPNTEGQMWVAPGTSATPQVQAQSAFIPDAGGCVPDGDLQDMWVAVPTDTKTSGVALSLGSDYQLNGL